MRNIVIGLIVGAVLGVVLGATVIAPRLERTAAGSGGTSPAPSAADLAEKLPRALVSRPAVSLKLAGGFPPDMPVAGDLAKRIDSRIWEVSRGQFEIRSYPPGALAAVDDVFEAVGAGAVDAALTTPDVAGNRVPALRIFAGVPFGPSADEFLAWLQLGGGKELFDSLNEQHNVHALVCGMLPPSAFGWFRHELLSVQDLKGLKMSAGGLAARALSRLGVDIVTYAPGDLMLAIEQGNVDAVAYASPAIDRRMEFGTWLKNYYPEGWKQSLTTVVLIINLKKWQQLNVSQQAQVETLCGDTISDTLAKGEAVQFVALKEFFAQGIRLQRLPPGILDALDRAWKQVVQQASSSDPDFLRVWQSLSAFRADYAIWRELSRP
ncbi:MAG: C4-dicarboxylate ABC transporter [Rhodospirillales bacterium]|nr:C4-dicarboxylate ABC transporter [Rhodospirillales bacterium]